MALFTQKTTMTLLAGALTLSLSACANQPIVNPDSRLGQASGKIGEASSDLWIKTKHVLRLDGTDAYAESTIVGTGNTSENPDKFKDELDLVLIEDEFDSGPRSAGIDEQFTIAMANNHSAVPVESLDSESTELMPEAAEPAAAKPPTLAHADLEYRVQPAENLWDISKRLTGDAMNWTELAALNSLDANGSVFGGQVLQIPGELLWPEDEPALVAAKPVNGTSENSANGESVGLESSPRLKVPTATAVEAVTDIVAIDAVAAETPLPAATTGPVTSFKVLAGDSMWDLAKRTTGNATNWLTIATANDMSPEQAALIKYGQSLDIPNTLLKNATQSHALTTAGQDATEQAVVDKTPALTEVAVTAAEPTATVATDAVAEKVIAENAAGELKIMPAKYQSEPPVINEPSAKPGLAADKSADWIMVSGTYYPKAIYNDANFSATLLTRVSPGTKLMVSRAIGPWFEVKTNLGMGYVHSRDIK